MLLDYFFQLCENGELRDLKNAMGSAGLAGLSAWESGYRRLTKLNGPLAPGQEALNRMLVIRRQACRRSEKYQGTHSGRGSQVSRPRVAAQVDVTMGGCSV